MSSTSGASPTSRACAMRSCMMSMAPSKVSVMEGSGRTSGGGGEPRMLKNPRRGFAVDACRDSSGNLLAL
mgnify:CR=1 FL=1